MANTKKFRFECTRCGNCCTDKDTLVNITYLDILRIKKGLNLTLKEVLEVIGFYLFETEPTDEDLNKMVISPIETEKGLAFLGLNKKNTGFCYFYDEENKKCSIYKLRPMFCRTFPFFFRIIIDKQDKTKAKIIMSYTEKGKRFCPGIGLDAPLIDENKWIKLGKKAIENMSDNFVVIKKWNKAVKSGQITPSVKNFLQGILKLDKN